MSVYWKETQFFPQKPDKLMKTPRGRHEDLPLSKSSKGVTAKEQDTSSARLGKGRWRYLSWTMSPMRKKRGRPSQFANCQRMQGQGSAWTRIGSNAADKVEDPNPEDSFRTSQCQQQTEQNTKAKIRTKNQYQVEWNSKSRVSAPNRYQLTTDNC